MVASVISELRSATSSYACGGRLRTIGMTVDRLAGPAVW
jgi:hypothetical protein